MLVPNIVNITYGRGVGYKFEEEVFEESITDNERTNAFLEQFKTVYSIIDRLSEFRINFYHLFILRDGSSL